jgi:cytochrome c oxidase subunit 2
MLVEVTILKFFHVRRDRMNIQEFVGLFSLSLTAVYITFIGFFIWITSRGSERKIEPEGGESKGHSKGMERAVKTWLMILLLVSIMGNALLLSPILPSANIAIWETPMPVKTVSITVKNYEFHLPEKPIKVKAGKPVEFLLKSKDVTYGFGVFRKDGSLVFQMTVFSGYDNKIIWIFDNSGLYTVRSTEYSGPRHPEMVVYDAILVEGGE